MKIAFFGTGEFSRNILSGILEKEEINVRLVVSQPDKPFGRKQELIPTKVKELAQEKHIEIMQPEKLRNNTEFFDFLKSLDLDFIVVVAYGKIVPKEVLEAPKYGCINIHGSILPSYRGASPIQMSLKNGDEETGLTIMYMSEGMDEGDILAIKKIDIDIKDKTPDIFHKFEKIGVDLLIESLNGVIDGKIKGKKQDNTKATYCKKIEKEEGLIDFKNEDVMQIYNKFRAFYPWPGIYTTYKGKKFQITDCNFEKSDFEFDDDFSLGDVIEYEDHGVNNIGILCNGGILILKKVKLEGKKEMDIFSFINGNKDFLEYNFL